MADRKIAVIAGAGPGNGLAMARRFGAGGYTTVLLARDGESLRKLAADIPNSLVYACDVTDRGAVSRCFHRIADNVGSIDVLLFNAGSGVFKSVEQISPDEFENSWRVNAYGSLLCAQAVLETMKQRGSGVILFTGATASLRGGKRTAAFAPAKAAQRSLAQSMARTLWPAGIHVGLLILDGVVDLPRARAAMQDKDSDFFINPNGVAEAAWFLAHQERRAWSFEIDVRPFAETW